MSYVKLDEASMGADSVTFYYQTTGLFNEIKLLSLYRAKQIFIDGKNEFDKFAITNDEEDFFDTQIGYVVNELFAELAKISYSIDDSVFVDTDKSGVVSVASGFSIKDYNAYNDNLLTVIDNRIRKAIVNYVLSEWWGVCGLEDERKKTQLAYEQMKMAMKDKAWELIKPLMS